MKFSVIDLLRDAWDRFLLYLPLGVMALLALGTYWLVRSTPSLDTPSAPAVASTAPDYFMEDFSIKTFDERGRMRSEVLGDRMRHFPQDKFIDIERIRIRSFDTQGRLTTASAKRGLTNEDGSEVQLLGNAVVVREAQAVKKGKPEPRMEYRGEFLHAFLQTEQLKSHLPVELRRGPDRFTADSLEFDNLEGVATLRGRVRGSLVPDAVK